MDPSYSEEYSYLYSRHWWWRAREAVVLDTLLRLQPTNGWGFILDVGCGDGLLFDRLLELGDVDGVEPSTDAVRNDGPHRSRITLAPFDQNFPHSQPRRAPQECHLRRRSPPLILP